MAPKVRVLPESLANQIAAGEVIERPASVVKELVENALDAGSSEVEIFIQRGGSASIEVRDNGEGMVKEDALLAFERHATSKLRRAEDLFSITSLGFRGEALPSISAVSKMELTTKISGALSGTYLRSEGGHLKEVREEGCPRGTRIVVKDLFYNVPARMKFLKSTSTEAAHIHETVVREALAKMEVGFRYLHDNRVVLDTSPAHSTAHRITDLLGSKTASQIYPVQGETNGEKIEGYLSHPNLLRSTSSGIYLFVNGRHVQDRSLLSAVLHGYQPLLPAKRYPVAILFLRVPSGEIDVNVHPSKREIRFSRPQKIYEFMLRSVRAFIREEPWIQKPVSRKVEEERPIPHQGVGSILQNLPKKPSKAPFVDHSICEDTLPFMREKGGFSDLHYIGQVDGTYILLSSAKGLVLIDQHAAHERILFEKMKTRRSSKKPIVQSMLLPIPIELSMKESSLIEKYLSQLKEIGVELRHFGGSTWRIEGLPTYHSENAGIQLIQEIVAGLMEMGPSIPLEEAMDRVLSILACHAAVQAHHTLRREEVRELLIEMDRSPSISRCPHGRPTYIEIDLRELERRFGRR